MDYLTLTRSTAAYWLSLVELYATPLRVMAQTPARCAGELQELQEEVWKLWGEQAPPVQEIIFG